MLCAVAGLLFPGVAANAQPPQSAELLEPARAFALSARGLDPNTVEIRYAIAPGYYLYRDKLHFELTPAGHVAPAGLPPAQMKHDPFFGTVATYRGDVVVRIALAEPAAGRPVRIVADSQGCADAGVCYPVQRQSITVALPKAGAGAGPQVHAVAPRKAWFD